MKIIFQANRLSQLNIDRANAIDNTSPNQADFNTLVNKVNDIIGELNTLPDARCNSVI